MGFNSAFKELKDAFSVFDKCRHNSSVGGQDNLFDDNKTICNKTIYRNLISNQYFLLDLVVSYLKADLTTETKPNGNTW
jgi:hypothetical protein